MNKMIMKFFFVVSTIGLSVLNCSCLYQKGVRLVPDQSYNWVFYHEGGAPGEIVEDLILELDTHRLRLDIYDSWEYREKHVVFEHQCTDEEWSFVLQNLKSAEIGSWEARYVNHDICDGTYWYLELFDGVKSVKKCAGANKWPKKAAAIIQILSFASSHPGIKESLKKGNGTLKEYKKGLMRIYENRPCVITERQAREEREKRERAAAWKKWLDLDMAISVLCEAIDRGEATEEDYEKAGDVWKVQDDYIKARWRLEDCSKAYRELEDRRMEEGYQWEEEL